MIAKLKQIITTFAAVAALSAPLAFAGAASAQGAINLDNTSPEISKGACAGANLDASQTGTCSSTALATDANNQLTTLIRLVINIFSLVVGVVAVIMIIIGGFRYITSGGSSENIQAAKNTIIYAIIGLVIVALAQFIVRFVLGRVSTGQ